jgi:DHA2 family multidrug resistance protein
LAPDFVTLLFWRAVQGFAGAGLTMWWRASVYMLMPLPERSRSMMRISVVLYSEDGGRSDFLRLRHG